jgi:large subunit ribosomal protein L25
MTISNLKAKRRGSDAPSSKRLRIEGEIPAIYYNKQHQSIPLKIAQKDLDHLLKGPLGPIRLTLENNETLLVVAKEIQKDPVGRRPIHMTFEGIKEGEAFHITLPIKLDYDENCGWMKEKGTAELRISKLNVEVLPKEMPEAIHININQLAIGDMLTVEDLKIRGVKFLDNPHLEVVSIVYRQIVEEEPAVKEPSEIEVVASAAPSVATPTTATKHEDKNHKAAHKEGKGS